MDGRKEEIILLVISVFCVPPLVFPWEESVVSAKQSVE